MPGQIALDSTSWDTAIQVWFDEAEHFPLGVRSMNTNSVKHYVEVKYFYVF